MFDAPDLTPLCYAPFVAISAAVALYAALRWLVFISDRRTETDSAERKRSARDLNPLILIGCVVLVPFLCYLSVALNIGARR